MMPRMLGFLARMDVLMCEFILSVCLVLISFIMSLCFFCRITSDSVDSTSVDSDYCEGQSADFVDPVSAALHFSLYTAFVDGLGVGRRRARDACRGHGPAIGCIHCWIGAYFLFFVICGFNVFVYVVFCLFYFRHVLA